MRRIFGGIPAAKSIGAAQLCRSAEHVSQYYNSITQEDSTGEDSTAQGDPNATRAVFFIDAADTQKVTIRPLRILVRSTVRLLTRKC
jgi:hypothetical protein